MIVKIHSRGKGAGAGPVDYLLGKNRDRQHARVLRGNPNEIIQLIDSSDYVKKYTSGVLSFYEKDLPEDTKKRIISSFEKAILPGLDKDQYSILWVEHKDKNRLELNFVIPNIELQSGKRLQPYFDRADRPRINAWKSLINDHHQLHDPNDPANRQCLTVPNNLPKNKQEAIKSITNGLLILAQNNEIKTRTNVIETLEKSGFIIAKTTPTSISIKNPEGGANIRLKGSLYEQNFRVSENLQSAIERASREYTENSTKRIQQTREFYQRSLEIKREQNIQRYKRPESPYSKDFAQTMVMGRVGNNNANLPIYERSMVSRLQNQTKLDNLRSTISNVKEINERGREDTDKHLRGTSTLMCASTTSLRNIRKQQKQSLHDPKGVLIDDNRIRESIITNLQNNAKTMGESAARNTKESEKLTIDVQNYLSTELKTRTTNTDLTRASETVRETIEQIKIITVKARTINRGKGLSM